MTGDHIVSWRIKKKPGNLRLPRSYYKLTLDNPTSIIEVKKIGVGTVYARSLDPNIASVSVDGNKVTVQKTGMGETYIAIAVGGDSFHNATAEQYIKVLCSANKHELHHPKPISVEMPYIGLPQTLKVLNAESPHIKMTGTDTETDKNEYEVFYQLADDQSVWIDEESDKIRIPMPEVPTIEFPYTGNDISLDINNKEFADKYFYIDDVTKAKNIGTYSATFSLKDKEHYCWDDETTDDITVIWKIVKLLDIIRYVSFPTLAENKLLYENGKTLTVALNEDEQTVNELYELTGDLKASKIGKYILNVALKDKYFTEWADGTTDDISLKWEIISNVPTKIVDECNNHWSIVGSPTIYSGRASKFGKGLRFQNGAYIKMHDSLVLGGEDFAIDFWMTAMDMGADVDYMTPFCLASSIDVKSASYSSAIMFSKSPNHKLSMHTSILTPVNNYSERQINFSLNKPVHYAITYKHETGIVYVFCNGKIREKINKTIPETEFDHIYLGLDPNYLLTNNNMVIDEFRISSGVYRWTNPFTPPREPHSKDQYTKVLLHFNE